MIRAIYARARTIHAHTHTDAERNFPKKSASRLINRTIDRGWTVLHAAKDVTQSALVYVAQSSVSACTYARLSYLPTYLPTTTDMDRFRNDTYTNPRSTLRRRRSRGERMMKGAVGGHLIFSRERRSIAHHRARRQLFRQNDAKYSQTLVFYAFPIVSLSCILEHAESLPIGTRVCSSFSLLIILSVHYYIRCALLFPYTREQ